MEEKQKKTAKTTNKATTKSSTNKTQAKKQTATNSKSNSESKKQDLNIENKKAAKATKKEPTATKKKTKTEPTLTIIHDKKEEKPDVTIVEKEVVKKPDNKKTKKETKKKEEKKVEKNNKTKAEKRKEKQVQEQVAVETGKEEKQQVKPAEKQINKKKKQYIDITIGSIVAVVIIIVLIILNIKLVKRAYNVMNNAETDTRESSSTKEIGYELEKDNELVQSIIEKITFAPSVTASIYDIGKFEEDNIPNTLKLRIGWNLVKGESKLQSVNENNEIVESIEQKVMEQSIKNIFGSKSEYKDEQFYNTNVSLFSTYAPNKGMIYYENGFYTNSYTKEDEIKIAPFIYQELQKVVKYSTEITVYVKAGYIDTLGDVCMIYKDLENGKLSRRILQVDVKELLGETSVNYSTGEGTISINENSALDAIRKKLNTYKYTLRLDETTGEYYLSSFEQEALN